MKFGQFSCILISQRFHLRNVLKGEWKLRVSSPDVLRLRSASQKSGWVDFLLSNDLMSEICNIVNPRISESHRGPKTVHFTNDEIRAMFRMFIERMGRPQGHFRVYMQSTTRCGRFGASSDNFVSHYRYKLFCQLFDLNASQVQRLFEVFSVSLRQSVDYSSTIPSHVVFSGDESGIPWTARHEWQRFIERKPNPYCILIYALATTLPRSGRPIVHTLLPDTFDHRAFYPHRVRSFYF